MTDTFVLDHEREERLGFGEAVLCAWKSAPVINGILDDLDGRGRPTLLTRLSGDLLGRINEKHRARLDYCAVSQTAFFGAPEKPAGETQVCVISAGSSDIPAAEEARRTLEFYGHASTLFHDIGVAGLWRLEQRLADIKRHRIVIVAAGMDGALVSVIGGLFKGMVIALPTSVGYGAANGGQTALNAALASCAPGVVAVNIDNGYGAAMAAVRALRALCPAAES